MSISAAAEAVIAVLKAGMPPLIKPEQIGLCLPDNVDKYLLGVHIYAITRDMKTPQSGKLRVDSSSVAKSPMIVELRVIITSYVGKKSSPIDDYKLVERVMQIWHDNSELPIKSPLQPSYMALPRMELLSPDADEISKIWQFTDAPYTLSLFYKLAPVVIQSAIHKTVSPVGSVDYSGGGV